jgi:hypothetical protein
MSAWRKAGGSLHPLQCALERTARAAVTDAFGGPFALAALLALAALVPALAPWRQT